MEIDSLSVSSRAALIRIGRRILEGFEGEIQLVVSRGGVNSITWIQFEKGDKIKEELT